MLDKLTEAQKPSKTLRNGGRACKPDSIMQKFGKSPKVFKLGITICHYMVYENIC